MKIFFASICLCFAICTTSFATQGEESLDIQIPVVDMNDFYDLEKRDQFLETLHQAMTKIGFFAVRNTGVNVEALQNAYAQSNIFFKRDEAEKASKVTPRSQTRV